MFVLFNCIVPIFNTYVFGFKCNTLVMLSMDYYYGAYIQLYGVFIEKYRKIFLVLIMIICIFNTFLLYLNDVNIVLSDLFFVKVLGNGKFGKVFLVHNQKHFYAIKFAKIKSILMNKNLMRYYYNEKKITILIIVLK